MTTDDVVAYQIVMSTVDQVCVSAAADGSREEINPGPQAESMLGLDSRPSPTVNEFETMCSFSEAWFEECVADLDWSSLSAL